MKKKMVINVGQEIFGDIESKSGYQFLKFKMASLNKSIFWKYNANFIKWIIFSIRAYLGQRVCVFS